MIVCVCYDSNILLRDEVDAKWVLQFCINSDAISIAVSVQVSWIVVSANEVSGAL